MTTRLDVIETVDNKSYYRHWFVFSYGDVAFDNCTMNERPAPFCMREARLEYMRPDPFNLDRYEAKYNAKVVTEGDVPVAVEFPSEKEATMFLLRWS